VAGDFEREEGAETMSAESVRFTGVRGDLIGEGGDELRKVAERRFAEAAFATREAERDHFGGTGKFGGPGMPSGGPATGEGKTPQS